jgi:hypothetical protein
MRDLFDVKGASGAVYRFSRFRVGNPLSAMGGNFVYARVDGETLEILYAGEAQNLLTGARARWDEAIAKFGAEGLFTRLNISEGVRQREHADILSAGLPPMNAAEADEA